MVETIGQLFLNTLQQFPKEDLMLYKEGGTYHPISSREFGERVRHFSLGLRVLGLDKGDKLIILAENGPGWVMSDLATLSLGGISVPIYTSLMPEQIRYIIDNSDASVVVCSSPALWEKVAAVRSELTKVRDFILLQREAPEGVLTEPQVMEKGKRLDQAEPDLFEKLIQSVKADDIASIIYTSGTTGVPKGVQLMHSNFVSNSRAVSEVIEFTHEDTALSFLPLSHVLERMVTFTYLYKGLTIAYAESVETVGENLIEVRPTVMVSVPRVFEKIYARVIDNVLTSPPLKRKIFFWAADVGRAFSRYKLENRPVPAVLEFKRKLAHKLVFSKIIEKTGGRVRFFVSGGAALSKDIAEFFYAMGLVVLEGYGLTETSPVIAVNTFEKLRFGTVGPLIPGVEVRIAEDGEILTRGPHVMPGYYNMPVETREAFRDDWFATGDIGFIDDDGFLTITDRKKDIIVTAGGKNVAPQMIENILKTNPYIDSAVVVGDKRKFVSALVVPNFEKLEEYARTSNIPFDSGADLISNDRINQFILDEIERSTKGLASYERVKKVLLLDRDFELEKGEVTPSLKIRRNIVEGKYQSKIDQLYKE